MKSYTAYCMNENGEHLCITREYETKKDFMSDLHGNGYKVSFIALTENYDEESQKYNERRIAKNRAAKIRRECAREWKRRDEEHEEKIKAALEEAAAEEQTTEEQPEEVPSFESVKDQLFAKVEHISAENAHTFYTTAWRRRGGDIALTLWISNERLNIITLWTWEENGIDENEVLMLPKGERILKILRKAHFM